MLDRISESIRSWTDIIPVQNVKKLNMQHSSAMVEKRWRPLHRPSIKLATDHRLGATPVGSWPLKERHTFPQLHSSMTSLLFNLTFNSRTPTSVWQGSAVPCRLLHTGHRCCWQAAFQVGHTANDGGATVSAILCWPPSIRCARPHGLELLAG